jgi:predicted deacylase
MWIEDLLQSSAPTRHVATECGGSACASLTEKPNMMRHLYRRLLPGVTLLLSSVIAHAATVYTGDKIEGVPVITRLDVADLAAGKTHRFMFRTSETSIGQYWYVPVMVTKGGRPGKRVLLVAGVHGDELNPVAAVQETMALLDPASMSGTVIGIMGASPPSLMNITRTWTINDLGGAQINPNRTWPGREDGNTVERHSWLITNQLIKGNVDAAVDHHTGGTGTDFAKFLFVYGDSPESIQLAKLFPTDQIMLDPGYPGTLEYSLVKAGIPAVTTELGGARKFVPEMVKMGVDGNMNVLIHYGIVAAPLRRTSADTNVFIGNDLESVRAVAGGFLTLLVKLNDAVSKGQRVAVQRNSFGDVVHEYRAPADGRVAIVGSDAASERGSEILTLLVNRADCGAKSCEPGKAPPKE